MAKKIAIIHYRAGRTDGVSLEIEKRKRILQDLGHDVRIVSGPLHNGSDCVIEALEFDTPEIQAVKENSFRYFGKQTLGEQALVDRIASIAGRIEKAFLAYHRRERFDALLMHNIFSHGRHIAAASAFARIAEALGGPVVATHHDYYWERVEYQEPVHPWVRAYLDRYVPPALENVVHVSINSLARQALKKRRDIDSAVLPDVFDFEQPAWRQDAYNADFLESIDVAPDDLVVLQATRIVERKGIELAVDFVKELARNREKLIGKTLYNGKVLSPGSRIVFVLAGYAEASAQPYLAMLKTAIERAGIDARFIAPQIAAGRRAEPHKVYALWDAYVFADLVTYPSLVEGWGNQFIEAVFAQKPIVLFEYPVYRADIKPHGYHVISLGDETRSRNETGLVALPPRRLHRAAEEACAVLTSRQTPAHLAANFNTGRTHHGFPVMRAFLDRALRDS